MEDYMKKLEELENNNCGFSGFYNIIINGISNLDKSERTTFLYAALNCIRNVGFKEGEKALSKDIINFITTK